MNTAYFIKVSNNMSWDELQDKILKQKESKTIPLPFVIIAEINISSIDFDTLAQSIQNHSIHYAPYTPLSTATLQGIWRCILINCIDDSRNILFYTSGNIYPLYASILNL